MSHFSSFDDVHSVVARDVSALEVEQFRAQGWVRLPGIIRIAALDLVAAELHRLMGVRGENHKRSDRIFDKIWRTYDEPSHVSELLWDFATSRDIGEIGAKFLRDHEVRFFRDEVYLKLPQRHGGGKATPWHQDFAYANRDRSEQINLWIPLTDVSLGGGTLRYLNGSHRMGLLGRGLQEHDLLEEYPHLADLKMAHAEPLLRGDALVHHGLTVHGAEPNTQSGTRWAYAIVIVEAGSRYTGTPWPARLAERMESIGRGEVLDHPLMPVLWPPGKRTVAPLSELTHTIEEQDD